MNQTKILLEALKKVGIPKVLYHGGPAGIKRLEPAPIFLSSALTHAQWFADEIDDGVIYKVRPLFKAPFDLDLRENTEAVLEFLDKSGIEYEGPWDKPFWCPEVGNHCHYDGTHLPDVFYINTVREWIVSKGFDSIFLMDILENLEFPTYISLIDGQTEIIGISEPEDL